MLCSKGPYLPQKILHGDDVGLHIAVGAAVLNAKHLWHGKCSVENIPRSLLQQGWCLVQMECACQLAMTEVYGDGAHNLGRMG